MSKLDPNSFAVIAELAYRESGLQLVAEKTSMIQSRLRHRLTALGVSDFEKYANLVRSDAGADERKHMISALTTNVSHFFREPHHFDILSKEVFPKAIERLKNNGRFRIWSAGCSNGQEAYSIGMTALQCYPEIGALDFKILATDIDAKVVKFAREGTYSSRLVNGIPPELLEKFFSKQTRDDDDYFVAGTSLQSLVTFKELNLLTEWPMKGRFDVIFCRNVVIYFDGTTQDKLWPKFRDLLADDGQLFLGHSERISDPSSLGFVNEGPTTYRLSNQT